jgi:hypothetical protein
MNLTDQEKRIKVADACGWTSIQQGNNAQGARLLGASPANKDRTSYDGLILHELPDYANDLNAMAEAEEVLTDEQHYDFTALMVKTYGGKNRSIISATAAQRFDAFGKTLNLW